MNASTQALQPIDQMPLDELCISTIRTLAMDAAEQARSGHPGTPMALAPAAYALWTQVLRYNPRHPEWFDRDRFVLSNGHASMLLYALLHLTGFDLSLEDIKNFRQWGSKTPAMKFCRRRLLRDSRLRPRARKGGSNGLAAAGRSSGSSALVPALRVQSILSTTVSRSRT
jgi:hypothetical protein